MGSELVRAPERPVVTGLHVEAIMHLLRTLMYLLVLDCALDLDLIGYFDEGEKTSLVCCERRNPAQWRRYWVCNTLIEIIVLSLFHNGNRISACIF